MIFRGHKKAKGEVISWAAMDCQIVLRKFYFEAVGQYLEKSDLFVKKL